MRGASSAGSGADMLFFKKKKFKVQGGRAGSIVFREETAAGKLNWEMLTGDASMVIYAKSCVWCSPHETPMQPSEVRRLAQEFSTEANVVLEISFEEGDEFVWPTVRAQLAADRAFYDLLGPERDDEPCRRPSCRRGAIAQSVLCRAHHFESIRGRPCPF